MGRSPCCSKVGLNKGAWTSGEDKILSDYILLHGEGRWRNLPKRAGLKRCGKSCRLRWLNYLRPDIKRGNISDDEQDLIIRLHKLLGNRWSLIAGRLPGRTDNEIKNYWNTTLRKKARDNHCHTAAAAPSSPAAKQCDTKKRLRKKSDKNNGYKLESTPHNVALQVTDHSPITSPESDQLLVTDTDPLLTQTSTPRQQDIVPDVDSGDIGLIKELVDFDFSGLLDTNNNHHGDCDMEITSLASFYEKPVMDLLDEFWSAEEPNLACNSNYPYFANSVSDFLGDWLA